MTTGDELQQRLQELEARKAANLARVRLVIAGAVALVVVALAVFFLPHSKAVLPRPPIRHPADTPGPGPQPTPAPPEQPTPGPGLQPKSTPVPPPTPAPVAAAPILDGNQIVALFGITVVGLLVYGAFYYGRVVTISFEISNTKKLLRINAGKSIHLTPKPGDL